MEDIIELVKEVFVKRIPRIELLQDDAKSRKTLYYKIFEGIKEGRVTSDADLEQAFYNENADNYKFRKLKSRFKERLYTTILFVQPRQTSPKSYLHNVYHCYKNQVIAKLLITIGAQKAGENLMKKVLAKAMPLQLFDVIQQCALALRKSSLYTGDNQNLNLYNKLFLEANNKLLAENRAEELYFSIIINFSNSLSAKPDLVSEIKTNIDEIAELKKNHDTYLLTTYYYKLQIVYYQFTFEYQKALQVCDELEALQLKEELFYTKSQHANTLVVKLDCCVQAHDYVSGAKCAEKALSLYPEGVENWFILLELYFLLSLNTNNIEKALNIYLQTTEHPRFGSLQANRREVWGIYGGYLSFLLHYRADYKELLKQLTKLKPEFRFSKLINEVPIYAKDKKGLNVAVLILQILILLQNKNYIQITKRTEALYQYTYRNLNKDDAYRSHYFIKMLIAMEKSSFNFEDTVRKTDKYLAKLRMENVQYSPTQSRMEIIPYEDLWKIILELLKRK